MYCLLYRLTYRPACRLGNLVTKSDWTQLSMDEGWATYLEYKCVEAVHPTFANIGPALFYK